ncbi:MAG: hypothetical protein KDB00_25680 [Planctomycetales bacterium]|nr:hypothetical protein [Planctomycetales bacterium]
MEDKLDVIVQERKKLAVGPRVRVGPKQQCATEPEVRIHREGNRIESIVISCACGEEITVICGYDEAAK